MLIERSTGCYSAVWVQSVEPYAELVGILPDAEREALRESIDPASDVAQHLTEYANDAASAGLPVLIVNSLDSQIRTLQVDCLCGTY